MNRKQHEDGLRVGGVIGVVMTPERVNALRHATPKARPAAAPAAASPAAASPERRALIDRLVGKGRDRAMLERCTDAQLQDFETLEHLKSEQRAKQPPDPTSEEYIRANFAPLPPRASRKPAEPDYTAEERKVLADGFMPIRSMARQLGGRKGAGQ